MKCQNCDAPVLPTDELCDKCGAKLLHRRVMFGAPKPEEFILTADEPPLDLVGRPTDEDWRIDAQSPLEPSRSEIPYESEVGPDLCCGGFFRRLVAFIVDLIVIFLFCMLMGLMGYIGYKVGLSAHDRFVSLENAGPLMLFLTFGWAFLTTAYFVVFHGMDGKTVGKWLLGLRVIAGGKAPVTYRQAFLRWLATIVVTIPLGIGIFWILLSREKRGWHDRIARTWVIRD
ncbi:MAG: RDD family protein [Candidatus Binatia bacterium]